MKKLILIGLLIISSFSFGQTLPPPHPVDSSQIKSDIRMMKSDIVFRGSMGAFCHTIGVLSLMEGKNGDPGRWQSFAMYNGVGVMFDVFTILRWVELRKYKKEHKLIKTSYR